MIDTPAIRRLVQAVPRPAGEQIPNGVTDDQLAGFEQRTGIAIPTDLRDWLRVSNGPCIGPGGFYGINTARDYLGIEFILGLRPEWRVKKWIPIAGDGCGNDYVMPTQQEYGAGYPVVFFDSMASTDVPSYIAASGVGHFLLFLLERELGAARMALRRTIRSRG